MTSKMVSSNKTVFLALLFSLSAYAQICNMTNPCPASLPCCSEFGFCGTGQFCLGGCNPMASNTLTSCRPNPICQSANYTFKDNSRILTNASYFDGNASSFDWVLDQGDILHTEENGGELVMTLTEANGGTRISSTRFIHYGTITATMKAGRWNGVVAAFITMSNIKDEIDWEFPGNQVTEGQTNFFWQGVRPDKAAGKTVTGLTDNYFNYHDYTIDWQPKTLTFSINGQVVQTINQADTVKDGISHFPNTPSRIQLSLWPAGINSSANGTIQWAGGMIDWTDPDYIASGHFYMRLTKLSVKCGDSPPAGASAYVYGGNATANTPTILFSNGSTLLNAGAMTAVPAVRHLGVVCSVVLASVLLGVVL